MRAHAAGAGVPDAWRDPRNWHVGGTPAQPRQTTFIGNHAAVTTVSDARGRTHAGDRPPRLTMPKVPWLSRAMLQRHTSANSNRTPATAAASLLVLVLITEPTGAGRAGA